MNRLVKFYDTPKGRLKMVDLATVNVQVTTGAQRQNNAKEWSLIKIMVHDDSTERYYLNMDRETAARVAKQITEYLEVKS